MTENALDALRSLYTSEWQEGYALYTTSAFLERAGFVSIENERQSDSNGSAGHRKRRIKMTPKGTRYCEHRFGRQPQRPNRKA